MSENEEKEQEHEKIHEEQDHEAGKEPAVVTADSGPPPLPELPPDTD